MQLTTTLISLDGLNYELEETDQILREILVLEAFVQFIEAFFYIWVILALKDLKIMCSRMHLQKTIHPFVQVFICQCTGYMHFLIIH